VFDVNLQSVANVAEIFGAMLVFTGVFFALVEIRHFRRQRRETAAMEIMRAFQSPVFTRALRLVMDFEQECGNCRDESISQELQDAAMVVSTTLESIGLMVYQRIVPFGLVQQLMGGTIQASWRVLRPHTEWLRQKLCRPSIHEWFQWLSERMTEYPEYRDEEGAYSKYLRWKPEKGTGSRQREGA
jgi:hypothetical protein